MIRTRSLLFSAVIFASSAALGQSTGQSAGQSQSPGTALAGAAYTGDGHLMFPARYRDWVYLTSGFDMSYSAAAHGGHHLFDNLFVNPAAYRAFARTGTWPEGTELVLELRRAGASAPINRQGSYQGAEVVGVEVHIKDAARFAGDWGFFSFGGTAPAKVMPHSADCYSCHGAHGAVDTTFVQFYPTLLPIARAKGTLSASYREETAASHP